MKITPIVEEVSGFTLEISKDQLAELIYHIGKSDYGNTNPFGQREFDELVTAWERAYPNESRKDHLRHLNPKGQQFY